MRLITEVIAQDTLGAAQRVNQLKLVPWVFQFIESPTGKSTTIVYKVEDYPSYEHVAQRLEKTAIMSPKEYFA